MGAVTVAMTTVVAVVDIGGTDIEVLLIAGDIAVSQTFNAEAVVVA